MYKPYISFFISFLCVCVCVCVCVGLSLGLAHIAVFDTQHGVGTGAAAGALPEDPLPSPERGGQAPLAPVTQPPRLAVALHLPLPPAGGAVPQHLLRPGRKNKIRICLSHSVAILMAILDGQKLTVAFFDSY